MSDTRLREWARNWLCQGGGGFEDGEDGIRAVTVCGESLVDYLGYFGESLVRACAEIAEAKNGLCPGMAILRAYGLSEEGRNG